MKKHYYEWYVDQNEFQIDLDIFVLAKIRVPRGRYTTSPRIAAGDLVFSSKGLGHRLTNEHIWVRNL